MVIVLVPEVDVAFFPQPAERPEAFTSSDFGVSIDLPRRLQLSPAPVFIFVSYSFHEVSNVLQLQGKLSAAPPKKISTMKHLGRIMSNRMARSSTPIVSSWRRDEENEVFIISFGISHPEILPRV